MDPDRLRRARAYRAFTLWTGISSTAAGIAVMSGLYVAGLGAVARDAVAGSPMAIGIFLIVSAFGVLAWVVQLPFAYALWARGRREGLVVQSLTSALADQVKGLALTLVLLGIPVTLWYLTLPSAQWWLWTIAGAAAVSALAVFLTPAISSLFFRFDPLADSAIADRVRAVAERAGVRVSGVYRWGLGEKTTAANAAVMGMGPSKRIVLGDTLIAHFPIDEIEAVVAHEVSHDVTKDPQRYLVALTVAGGAALIVVRLVIDALTSGQATDPATYPLFAALFALLGLLGRPLFMAFTRWRESAADAFGARHTSREAMARALVRLADQNLSDPEPPRWEELWFYSHPAIANRVRALGLRWEEFATAV